MTGSVPGPTIKRHVAVDQYSLIESLLATREPDCPACGEPYKPGQECQQQPWEAFRDYLPTYCKGDRMITAPIVEILRWNAGFGPENNTSERAAKNIDDLCSCLEELSRSADTAQVLLNQDYPGEANSLGLRVRAAIDLLATIRCKTCNGLGRIEELGGSSHTCADCAPVQR